MYKYFEQAIKQNPHKLNETLNRIDAYHIRGKLTDEQRESLIEQARKAAQPNVDAADEIQRLWSVMRDLQEAVTRLNTEVETLKGGAVEDGGTDDGEGNTEAVKEYVQPTGAHDAYFANDVVSYNGKVYTCIAPDGVACVWSPEVMPDYWRMVTADE